MSRPMLNFIIRDGLETDIEACLALDHTYQTDYVWQMTVRQEQTGWHVAFRTERLPRTLDVEALANEARLRAAALPDQCFLVAVDRSTGDILAYLTMQWRPVQQNTVVQDVIVTRDVRRARIGSRLLSIARQWAVEHDAARLYVETQTKNYPGIQFCQSNGLTFCGFNDNYFPNQDIAIFFGQSLR